MKCKICNEEKSEKHFYMLEDKLDDCCSACRAKQRAKREPEEMLCETDCFADGGDTCNLLIEKDCYECAFYKIHEKVEMGRQKALKRLRSLPKPTREYIAEKYKIRGIV